MDWLLLAGSCVGAVLSIITLLTLIIKPLRSKFAKWVTKTANTDEFNTKFDDINTKLDNLANLVEKTIEQNEILQTELDKQSEALKASLRNSILRLYYCCLSKGYITTYQLRNLAELYSNYKSLGGNSFISQCYEYLTTKINVKPDQEGSEGGM